MEADVVVCSTNSCNKSESEEIEKILAELQKAGISKQDVDRMFDEVVRRAENIE